MPRVCTVCSHPERDAVDAALVSAAGTIRGIADTYGVSRQAAYRHTADHLPAHLARAREAADYAASDSLLDRLRGLNRETADVLRAAKTAANHDLRLRAIARAEKQLELEARLLGELQDGHTVNLAVLPEWASLRALLMATLAPYPEARAAVASRLTAGGGDGGS